MNQNINCLLIEKRVGNEILINYSFINYSHATDDVSENLEDYNLTKENESVNSVWWYDSRYGI